MPKVLDKAERAMGWNRSRESSPCMIVKMLVGYYYYCCIQTVEGVLGVMIHISSYTVNGSSQALNMKT